MKLLLLTIFLTSCAYSKYPLTRSVDKKEETHVDKMEKCVLRLIENNNKTVNLSKQLKDALDWCGKYEDTSRKEIMVARAQKSNY